MKHHIKKIVYILIVLLLVFAGMFWLALSNLNGGTSMLNLGMPQEMENMTVMLFSALAVIKVFAEIVKIELKA